MKYVMTPPEANEAGPLQYARDVFKQRLLNHLDIAIIDFIS
jgi:hypothetical protein